MGGCLILFPFVGLYLFLNKVENIFIKMYKDVYIGLAHDKAFDF